MQMVRNFKSAKIQLTLTNSEHPKGVKHPFNNIIEDVTNEQVAQFSAAIEMLTAEKCLDTDIIVTSQVALNRQLISRRKLTYAYIKLNFQG